MIFRQLLRSLLFGFFERVVNHDEGRRALYSALPPGIARTPRLPPWPASPPPYAELAEPRARPSGGASPIFITARFRSGSTLLWNIFRRLPGFTSYYEPLNERRWFDPASRGARLDATHLHADSYWDEYADMEDLGQLYRQSWIDRDLYMDEFAWNPDMRAYIQALIDRAPHRPVLQFNRVDFRLPWLRRNFPRARFVHLFRNPRDQWCSTLLDPAHFPASGRTADFLPHDGFYLLAWCRDLKFVFPFLDPDAAHHPYVLFYYLWKLSYFYGTHLADASIPFEQLVTEPESTLAGLLARLGAPEVDLAPALTIIERPTIGKWQNYAPDSWFRSIEHRCDETLATLMAEVPTVADSVLA